MADTERTFNILELCCFPKGCKIDEESQPMLATVLVPKLEQAGMTTVEWTRGALMLEEPHLSRVKSIVCRGCMHFECEHNTTPRHDRSPDMLEAITDCNYAERSDLNAKLVEALIPAQSIKDWSARGVNVEPPFSMSSRTRFSMSFVVEHPTKGKTRIRIEKRKGECGEISVYGTQFITIPLPRTAAEASLKLREIVNAAM